MFGRSPAFRPLSAQTGGRTNANPFRVQQAQARTTAERARGRLPDHPAIPKVNGLYLQRDLDRVESIRKRATFRAANAKTDRELRRIQRDYEKAVRRIVDRPTDELIGRVRDEYKRAARKVGGTSIHDLYEFGSTRQRREMAKVGRIVGSYESGIAARNAAQSGIPVGRDRVAARAPREKVAGLPVGDLLNQAGRALDERTRLPNTRGSLADVANIPVQLARATIEDPGAVARSSVRTAVESIAGIPQGVKALVTDPKSALAAMAKDYERRYGSIFNNPAAFRKMVKEDTGLTPFVLDAASLGVPVGRAATLLARTGPAGRAAVALARVSDGRGALKPLSDFATTAHRAARAPREARRLQTLRSELERAQRDGDTVRQAALRPQIKRAQANVRSTERPALRFSGGEGGVRAQASSKNLIVGLGQRGLDRSRRRAFEKRAGGSGMSIGPGGRLVIPEDTTVSRMTAFRPGEREVVPKTTGVIGRSGRELPGIRKYGGRVARDLGGEQSTSRIRLLTHRGRTLNQIDRALRRLGPDEQASMKYMLQLGATPDGNGVRLLRDRRAQIMEARAGRGSEVAPILRDTNDEVRLIDRILESPARFLTPKAREVATELRELQIREARRDPELNPEQEVIRRVTPQGAALGVTRGPDVDYFRGVLREIEDMRVDKRTGAPLAPGLAARADELASLMPDQRAGRAGELLQEARGERVRAEQRVGRADVAVARESEALAAREQFQGQPAGYRVTGRPERFDTMEDAADFAATLPGRPRQIKPVYRTGRGPAVVSDRQIAQAAERKAVAEREQIAANDVARGAREFEKAFKQVVRASKSTHNARLESAQAFAGKVRQAADDAGLEAPAYWWSSMYPRDTPSLAAAGRGTRAAHANRPYKGKLFDVGAEEHDVNVFTRGIERNIKRRFQQALVARNMETHAYEWSRGPGGAGMTIADLEKLMIDRAIDPSTIEFVDPRVLRRRYSDEPGIERGTTIEQGQLDDARAAGVADEDWVTTTQQDLAAGRRRWEEIANDETLRQAQHRFLAVPREVGETLDGIASGMDNKFWRSMEIVLKQKPARILLGAANVPWLAFQVASNALLTGIGGGVNPFNVHGAHKWWRGLTPDQKEAVEAELGITHGHHFGMDQTNLGASNARMVNFWRAYKTSRVGRAGTRINPLNVMFRADEAQNNFFRRVLFYDRARKAAYRRMGSSWTGIDRSMTRAIDRVLARPPEQQAHLIARHGQEFENVAKHVNDFLGDYMRFTPAERFLLQRNVMFYGYLRFSLRFTFYTMPVAHPIMTNIMTNIGRMGADEIKDLMGVPHNYQLPPSMLSQTYFGDRKDAEKDELRSLPLGRFNPFLNTLTQLDGLQQAVGLVSPMAQALADQMFEESTFTGRDWRIGGRPTPSGSERPRNYFGSAGNLLNPLAYDVPGHEGRPRNRILEQSLLNLAYPYRVANKTGIPGIVKPLEANQADDALLWRPEPMQYADEEAKAGVEKSRREQREHGPLRKLASATLPVFPERTASPAVVARELEKEAAIRERNRRAPGTPKKRRRRKPKVNYGFGGSSGGTNPYGGSARSNPYGG